MSDTGYTRLPGAGRRRDRGAWIFAPRSTLWLAGDHLLVCDSSGYAEEYRRFAFADIQAIAVARTRRYTVWAAVWGAVLAAMGAAALASSGAWRVAWISIGGIAALVLCVHLVRGPTCKATLTTATRVEELSAWHRMRNFEHGLIALRPHLEAAQEAAAPPGPPAAPA